jgi:hypothetical protein
VSRLTVTAPPGGCSRTSNPGWPRGPPPVGASRRDLPAGCARRSPERSPGDGGSIPPTSTTACIGAFGPAPRAELLRSSRSQNFDAPTGSRVLRKDQDAPSSRLRGALAHRTVPCSTSPKTVPSPEPNPAPSRPPNGRAHDPSAYRIVRRNSRSSRMGRRRSIGQYRPQARGSSAHIYEDARSISAFRAWYRVRGVGYLRTALYVIHPPFGLLPDIRHPP